MQQAETADSTATNIASPGNGGEVSGSRRTIVRGGLMLLAGVAIAAPAVGAAMPSGEDPAVTAWEAFDRHYAAYPSGRGEQAEEAWSEATDVVEQRVIDSPLVSRAGMIAKLKMAIHFDFGYSEECKTLIEQVIGGLERGL